MRKVSVIIPTYNRAHYIGEAIQSVLDQDIKDCDLEIIVIDDGSTDDTRKTVSAFGSDVKYIIQENQGAGAARNNGIRKASGEWITFLDSDDRWLPYKLSLQFKILEKFPQYSAVHSNFYTTENSQIIIQKGLEYWADETTIDKEIDWNSTYSRSYESADFDVTCSGKPFKIYTGNMFRTLLDFNCLACWTLLARRECFNDSIRFHDSCKRGEDWWFSCQFSDQQEIIFLDCPTVENRAHSGDRISADQIAYLLEFYLDMCTEIFIPSTSQFRPNEEDIHRYYGKAKAKLLKEYIKKGDIAKARLLLAKRAENIGLYADKTFIIYKMAAFFPFNIISRLVKIKKFLSGRVQ